jgi:prophage regulatory protein
MNMYHGDYFLRLPQVCSRIGLGRSTILALVKERVFPEPVKLSARAVAWSSNAVQAWIDQRIAAKMESSHQQQMAA